MNRFHWLVLIVLSFCANYLFGDTYVVQKGDSLRKIALQQLGDESKWRELADLNGIKEPFGVNLGAKIILRKSVSSKPALINISDDAVSGEEIDDSDTGMNPSIIWHAVWYFALAYLVVFGIFGSIFLKMGCWFSLVEASFFRCVVFSLISSFLFFVCIVFLLGVSYFVLKEMIPSFDMRFLILLVLFFYGLGMAIFMKKYFACKWRSLFTIFAMTNFSSHLFSFGFLWLLLLLNFSFMNLGALKAIWHTIVSGDVLSLLGNSF